MKPDYIVFFHIGTIVLVLFFLAYSFYKAKMRVKDFATLANRMGFTFFEEYPEVAAKYERKFKIFDRGRSRKITAYMEKEKHGIKIAAFDYKFVTGGGKNSSTHKHTFISFTSDAFSFPAFTLIPEHAGHKMIGLLGEGAEKKLLGFTDIDFNDSPEFSAKYLLGGNQTEEIKKLFTPTVREKLEIHNRTKNKQVEIYADRDTMLFGFRQSKVKIKNIPGFIQMCNNILQPLIQ